MTNEKDTSDTTDQVKIILDLTEVYEKDSQKAISSAIVTQSSLKEETTLASLRAILSKQKAISYGLTTRPFCTKEKSEVKDNLTFLEYLHITGTDEKTVFAKAADGKPHRAPVYFSTLPSKVSESVQKAIGKGVNLEVTQDGAKTVKVETLEKKDDFKASDWAAKPADNLAHPFEMTEEEWDIVIANNGLLSGYIVTTKERKGEDKLDIVSIERSMYPAFRLRPRRAESYELFHKANVQVPEEAIRIPRIQVKDDSHVEITHTTSTIQDEMANASFSSKTIEASVGGGFAGYSMGVSAGITKSDSATSADNTITDKSKVHAIYRFPRVALALDAEGLELTPECAADWRRACLLSKQSEFFDKYGHFIPMRVQLGGRLSATETCDSTKTANATEAKSALKASASLAFSSPYAQASVNVTGENQTVDGKTHKSTTSNMTITWEAHGGNTLLANSPRDWCATVGTFYNWRVMNQDNVIPIKNLLPEFTVMSQQVDIGASAGEGKGKMTGSMGHMSPDEPLAESEVHYTYVDTGSKSGKALEAKMKESTKYNHCMVALSTGGPLMIRGFTKKLLYNHEYFIYDRYGEFALTALHGYQQEFELDAEDHMSGLLFFRKDTAGAKAYPFVFHPWDGGDDFGEIPSNGFSKLVCRLPTGDVVVNENMYASDEPKAAPLQISLFILH